MPQILFLTKPIHFANRSISKFGYMLSMHCIDEVSFRWGCEAPRTGLMKYSLHSSLITIIAGVKDTREKNRKRDNLLFP